MDSLTNELSQIGNLTSDTNETDVGAVKLKWSLKASAIGPDDKTEDVFAVKLKWSLKASVIGPDDKAHILLVMRKPWEVGKAFPLCNIYYLRRKILTKIENSNILLRRRKDME